MDHTSRNQTTHAPIAALVRLTSAAFASVLASALSLARQSEVQHELQIIPAPSPLNGNRLYNEFVGGYIGLTSELLLVADSGTGTGERGGELYTYSRSAHGWQFEDRLVAKPGEAFQDLAIQNGTLVAGNYQWGWPVTLLGRVHIFERDAQRWVKQQDLFGEGLDPNEQPAFGSSVALSGDVLVIGAPGVDEPVWGGGELRVYERVVGVWQLVSRFRLPPLPDVLSAKYYHLGIEVQVQGNSIVAGASGNQGAVYVYERIGKDWTHVQIIENPSPLTGDFFGRSLALKDNLLIVGQPALNEGRRGTAFIYERVGSGPWSLQREIRASDGYANSDSGDQFGAKVAIDNAERIVVSAPRGHLSGPSTGTIYVFEKAFDSWPETECVRLAASDSSGQSDFLGWSLAVDNGFVASGAIGAWHEGVREGKAYVLPLAAGATYCSEDTSANLALVGSDVISLQSLTLATSRVQPFTRVLNFIAPFRGTASFSATTLCLGPPITRFGPVQTDSNVLALYKVDFAHPWFGSHFLPGTSWFFQSAFEQVLGSGRFDSISNAVRLVMR